MATRDDNVSVYEEFLQFYRNISPLWKTKSPEYHDKLLKAVCYGYLIKKTELNKK